jgi:enterochelin esterase-like enzyme
MVLRAPPAAVRRTAGAEGFRTLVTALVQIPGPRLEGTEIVFTWRDPRRRYETVRLAQDLWRPRLGPEFEPDGGVWRLRVERPAVDRMEYQVELTDDDGDARLVCDPVNPLRVSGPFGDRSVLHFPEYRPPAWLDDDPPSGRVRELELESRVLRTTVTALVWTSAGAADEDALPLLVVHDGPEYADYSALLQFLDQAGHGRRVPPFRAALLPPPGDRNETYSASAAYARALVRNLLPELRRHLPTLGRPVGAGASLGALAFLHAHRLHPHVFGGLFLQSGSFFRRRFDAHEAGFGRFGRIARFVGRVLAPSSWDDPVPVRMTCGAVEENLRNNRAAEQALRTQGYDVELHELRDAHNWVAWRDGLDPHLADVLTLAWS